MEDIRIIFVLPESHEDETQCSDIMQSSFEYCKQNVPSEVEWLRESALQSLELKKTDFVVFDEFKGEYFNYVNSTKCARIVGPKALSYCLLEGKPIPNFDWPIYNVAMYDCIVTCSFLPKELKLEMKNKIQLMGGYYSESLVEKTTHLIAGSAKSQKYLTAAETGKKLMQTTWIEEVWKLSQTGNVHADNKEFEKHRCPPFHNLVICSSGITDLNDKRKIENLVNEGGGKFTGKLRVAETDFLVCSGDMANSAKYKAARQSANIRCVNVSWIIDSVKSGYALPHEPYQIQKMTSTPTKIDCPINPDFSVLSAIGNATAAQRMSIDDTNIPGGAINSPANNKRKVTEVWEDLIENLNIYKAKKAGQYLDGLSVLLIGFSSESLEKLHKIINLSGATRYDSFSERVTHVIVGDSNNQELACIKNKNTSAIIVSLHWLIESIERQQPVNEENYLVFPENENPNLGSPLSKKGLSLLHANRTATRNELENDTNDENTMHGRNTYTDVSDTLGNLLGGISNSGLCKAVQQIEPMDSEQFREISSRDESFVPLTQDAESEINKFFDHLQFFIFDFSKDDYEQLKDLIRGAGGKVVDRSYKGNVDYAVVPIFNKKKLRCSATEIVNHLFIEECVRLEELILSPSYYHKPFVLPDTKPLKNCVITTSTYVAQERIFLQNLIEGLGATVQDLFSRIDKDSQNLRANTHLVSSEAQGKKYNAAQKWGLPVINKDWLIECVRTGKKVEEDEYILDKVSKNKEQSGNWSSQTGGVSTSNAPGGSQESTTHSPAPPYPKKLLSSKENVPTTPVSDKARKEYTVPPVWSLMKTPETPYGTFLTPNPSPNTRKQFAYWLEQMPDRPSPDSNKSTPLSEIKRQLEKRCNEIGKFKPLNFDELNNSELGDDKEETNKEDKSKENELLDSKFQELENLLSASDAGKRQTRKFQSNVPFQVNSSEFQDSPPCTVEWDYKTQETKETKRKVFSISGIDDLSVKTKMLERLEQLGGSVSHSSNYDPLCTHLICARPIRNEKALSCMAAGKWILHISYLEQSFEAGYLLNEEEFEFGNPKAIGRLLKTSNFDSETEVRMKMMHRWRQEIAKRGYGAFNDMRAIIVASKSEPIARVIEAGGGVVVNVEPPFEGNIFATHCLLEMKSVKNLEDFIPLAQQGIFVVNTIYISDFLHEPNKDIHDCILPHFTKYYKN